MTRRNLTFILALFTSILFIFITLLVTHLPNKALYTDMILSNFGSSDAKLGYKGYVVTSKNEKLCLINSKSQEIFETNEPSNWIGTLTNENVIVFTSRQLITKVCRFNPDTGDIYDVNIILNDGILRIDPVITKKGNKYFLCITKIDGSINRNDLNQAGGNYSIEFYSSSDLINWEFVNVAINKTKNIEDVKFIEGDKLAIIYEEEIIDMGSSIIYTISSDDEGKNWSKPNRLITNGYDNEPASFILLNKKYYLFFSSDMERRGKSYEGSLVYCFIYNSNLDLLEKNKIKIGDSSGILLYDVQFDEDKAVFLYAYDYIGSDDLCLKVYNLNEILV